MEAVRTLLWVAVAHAVEHLVVVVPRWLLWRGVVVVVGRVLLLVVTRVVSEVRGEMLRRATHRRRGRRSGGRRVVKRGVCGGRGGGCRRRTAFAWMRGPCPAVRRRQRRASARKLADVRLVFQPDGGIPARVVVAGNAGRRRRRGGRTCRRWITKAVHELDAEGGGERGGEELGSRRRQPVLARHLGGVLPRPSHRLALHLHLLRGILAKAVNCHAVSDRRSAPLDIAHAVAAAKVRFRVEGCCCRHSAGCVRVRLAKRIRRRVVWL